MTAKRKTGSSADVPVQAIRHDEKRVNIPTADSHDIVSDEAASIQRYIAQRDRSLDPQLVWTGKDTADAEDLVVDAPPIYIQEKIAPRALIAELQRASTTPKDEFEQPALFADDYADFDGLDPWEAVEYYQHQANWSNRMILGDSLRVMASLAEKERLRGKVQMIYIDPPYGIKFGSNWQVSTRKRDVKDGNLADATREVEQIKAFRDTWEKGIHSYLAYLRDRVAIARDLLTESGSIFIQIGDENVHLVRSLLDEVFGSENFAACITYTKTAGQTADLLPGTADYILWYAKRREVVKYRRLYQLRELGGPGSEKYDQIELPDGSRVSAAEALRRGLKGRAYRLDNLTSQSVGRLKGEGAASWFSVEVDNQTFRPTLQTRWKTNEEGMLRLRAAGRLQATKNTLSYVRFHDDFPAYQLSNVWSDIGGIQSRVDPKIYVVQTSTRALQRCMLMCTDPGDLVLDPTCGSGTTANVAEQWARRWITIDTSRVAITLARQRIIGARYPSYLLVDSDEGRKKERELTGAMPPDSPTANDVRKGFVCERVPHVTLKSIANNPDIKEGMTREQIEAAIQRHAPTEVLYDRPYEDKKRVRVAGPFTVESLSPHRAATFELSQEQSTATDADSYLKTILDNLTKAGVQNGWRNDRLEFASLTPHPGQFVHAEGARRNGEDGTPVRIAVSVGPQYGTVDAEWIKAAAREALRGVGFDLLLICAFSFDAHASAAAAEFKPQGGDFAAVAEQRKLGRLPILLVRMNSDLAMGEALLKKTGAANLFTVFGEPDVSIDGVEEGLVVEIRGVDVYNPTTGELRTGGTDEIAMWMLDTFYDEEEFCVRHLYFAGTEGKPDGLDPYARLRRALRARVDEVAWATMYSTRSRPFPRPESGKIAVKVINHYGDEVLKVYDV
jgi:adenine-specific DNA-methyltransferase